MSRAIPHSAGCAGRWSLLAGVTLAGTLLRIWSPGRIGLWRDEAQVLSIASLPTLAEITRFLKTHESHPPLFYYLTHWIDALTGHPSVGLGLLTLSASIALIPAVWWLASLSGVRGAAPVAAALTALSVPLAFFSVQLRPYSLVSFFAVVGAGALLRGVESGAARWKLLWAVCCVCLLYLHHVGVFVIAAMVVAGGLLVIPSGGWRGQLRDWWPFMTAVAVVTLPDLFMLAHQSVAAPFPAARPWSFWRPWSKLWTLFVAFPGEVAVSMLGCSLLLLLDVADRKWRRARVVATLFLTTIAFLTVASYRSQFLAAYIVMALVPLGMAAAGIAIAEVASPRRPWRSVLLVEGCVVAMVLSFLSFVGNGKTNTDLMARYIEAEARPGDLVVLVPGPLGASFNWYYRGVQPQIDYPVIGRVLRYEFDGDFGRMSALGPLRATIDSLRVACLGQRRVWLVTPIGWIVGGTPPLLIGRETMGGVGQADAARANLIERRARHGFGPPIRFVSPDSGAGGMELLTARLYGPVGATRTPEGMGHCDFS